ncbi:MAG: GIY-YIG nuclease family protein [Okeania sp. SIO3I5]|uniref:GIY-YIG nuclease family protein n=1 Tax=Okeania sp. SIO3I5 TaxID=2607805 RepID=UPI0013BB5E4C|nr:GIY-YIG nuclease family protein [Okeania sp. SIO3I5]NEQ41508.1 GIY-YIG nuclease family protein [Okeania sp. SIO3I5]
MAKKKTKEEILSEFIKVHGDYYDYSKVEYINTSTKIKVICPKHGLFEITPGHHKNGVGCRKCYFESQKITKEEFVKRSQKHFGDRYDYSLFNTLPPAGEMVEILCVEHGKNFLQEPRNHMRGYTGCSICQSRKLSGSIEDRGTIKSQKELTQKFIKRAQEIHGDTYDYSKFEYINSSTKGKIICSIHGDFFQTPSNHLKGTKCPKCSIEKQKENSFKKLCNEKNVNYYRALKRREAGLPEEKIFAEGFVRNTREINQVTVFGETYPNLEEAIRILQPQASSRTIKRWIKEGMTPEEAFQRIPNPGYAQGLIYLITNKVTDKKYVGLTVQKLERRWEYHVQQARANYIKSGESLHTALREYGEDAFEIKAIDKGTTKKDLEVKERKWIEELNTLVPYGYNISKGGVSGGSHKKPTTIDNICFESVKKAAEYLAKSRNISIAAAEKRIHTGRVDVKKTAKPGQSLIKTKAYKAWSRIIHGALNPNSKEYIPDITIDENWRDFNHFFRDVGNPPEQGMAFTRLDKSQGFFPSNCAWLTKSEASKLNAAYMKKIGKLTGNKKKNKLNDLARIN